MRGQGRQWKTSFRNILLFPPRFKYQSVDPDRKPALAAKYGVSSYRTTLLISGKGRRTVGIESWKIDLTNGIIKVTRDNIKTVLLSNRPLERNSITDFQKERIQGCEGGCGKENYRGKNPCTIEH